MEMAAYPTEETPFDTEEVCFRTLSHLLLWFIWSGLLFCICFTGPYVYIMCIFMFSGARKGSQGNHLL